MDLSYYLFALNIAIFSVVYVNILCDEGMILFFWWRFLHKHIKNQYILKPIVDCDLCFSGQAALWFYVFYFDNYNFILHIFFISLVIFTVYIINKFLESKN